MNKPLHPTQLTEGTTPDLELGLGTTPWFGLAVEPTVDHTVRLKITVDDGYADDWDGSLEMSPQDALEIIEALSKAIRTALASRSEADPVLIDRWNLTEKS